MFQVNRNTVVRGRPYQLPAFLVDENGNQFPTCGVQAITLYVQKEDDTFFEKVSASGLVWGYGEKTSVYLFNFTEEETVLFKLGQQTAFLKLTFTDTDLKFALPKFVTTVEEIF